MMKLKNVENQVDLELSIDGYQFPENPEDDWCLVRLTVRHGDDVFRVVDPALCGSELKDIFEWFSCLSERRLPKFAQLSFIEPCLEFQFLACTGSAVRVAILLSHELKPGFHLRQLGSVSAEWRVVFDLSDKEFDAIKSEIKTAMMLYAPSEK